MDGVRCCVVDPVLVRLKERRLVRIGLTGDGRAGRIEQHCVALSLLRRPMLVRYGESHLDRREGVDQPRALLIGRCAEIGCRTHDDPLDERGARIGSPVSAAVGLDDQRSLAGGQRRRLAGSAKSLNRRGAGRRLEIRAIRVQSRVRRAKRPSEIARRHHIDGARIALRKTA